ncbi:RING-2 [Verticillium alfalfae VaMs.102]|uniref:Methylated-DNA--protein-cysteine methyltransferase n=1 Tax=Verticillium alfalfae (strain VaMs.102 / ATCC MYA-4576 / FGSC 10136) TaxID=526221 RepID=C9SKH9_VERA1|nr:RING-2 [Verticillium alfalfae VaMs.102]EEY19197.1 RING-2 [Verticillium alfalfae VaMs.102]
MSSTSTSPKPAAAPKSKMTTYDTKDMGPQLDRIAASTRTTHEKRVWTALCQVPKGQVTTYAILAAHLGSSPRAVGNALRRNPFAPQVPCHRVVATGGKLGGFKGKWPRDGEGITLDEKRMLLRREGVKIDDAGPGLGDAFSGIRPKCDLTRSMSITFRPAISLFSDLRCRWTLPRMLLKPQPL